MGQSLCGFGIKVGVRNEIDDQLEAAHQNDLLNPKILLLGTGECGKSTVVKQINLIWKVGGGFSDADRSNCILALRRNVVEVMQTLVNAVGTLGISVRGAEEIEAQMRFVQDMNTDGQLTLEAAQKIKNLWKSPQVQEAYSRRAEFWLLDATPFYMSEIDRIVSSDFDPSEDDLLMARVRTAGIVTTQVPDPPLTYHVVDVGGQRSERRKWINCFDNVNAIIFLESLAGYNQVLFEDERVNRMHESLKLFEDILKNKMFKDIPIFLFLNKKDLFESMISMYPLNKCFPDYDGPDGDARMALQFIEDKFRDVAVLANKEIRIHVIAARVRMDIKVAFGEVKNSLSNLKRK